MQIEIVVQPTLEKLEMKVNAILSSTDSRTTLSEITKIPPQDYYCIVITFHHD